MANIGIYAASGNNALVASLLNSAIVVNDYGALVRASTAYDWQTRAQVAVNTRRRLDLNLLGRRLQADLVEGSSTNEQARSIPSDTWWANGNITDTIDPVGIDPVFTGISVVEQEVASASQPHVGHNLGLALKTGICCVSAFFKKHPTSPSACATIALYKGADGSDHRAIFDFDTQTFGTSGTIESTNYLDVGNGWYWLWVVFGAVDPASSDYVKIGQADVTSAYGGTVGNKILISHVQAEVNRRFPSSPIPTAGSDVTRAQDELDCTLPADLQGTYTLFLIHKSPSFQSWGSLSGSYPVFADTNNDGLYSSYGNFDATNVNVFADESDATGVDFTSSDTYAPSNTELTTLAIRADGSNIKTIINGSTIDTGVAYDGTISAGNNIIRLGWISGSTINHNYAYTLGLLWNGTALTDAEIELLDQRIRLWN